MWRNRWWKRWESGSRGQRVLLARAAVARDVIPDALRARGATVDVVDAYRTVVPAESVATDRAQYLGVGRALPGCRHFYKLIDGDKFSALAAGSRRFPAENRCAAISIGPVTSQTLRDHGWEPAAEADPHDLNGLVQAVVRALAKPS